MTPRTSTTRWTRRDIRAFSRCLWNVRRAARTPIPTPTPSTTSPASPTSQRPRGSSRAREVRSRDVASLPSLFLEEVTNVSTENATKP
ncbi:hypothetical protein SGLAM104S_07943 [Streptomyces glaucescens]